MSDSSRFNQLLSLAWETRKRNVTEADYLVYYFGCSKQDAEFVINFVAEGCYSHEEFLKLLKESKFAQTPQSRLDRAS